MRPIMNNHSVFRRQFVNNQTDITVLLSISAAILFYLVNACQAGVNITSRETLLNAQFQEISALYSLEPPITLTTLNYEFSVDTVGGGFSYSLVPGQTYNGESISVSVVGSYDSATGTYSWAGSGLLGASTWGEEGQLQWVGDPTGTLNGNVDVNGEVVGTVTGTVEVDALGHSSGTVTFTPKGAGAGSSYDVTDFVPGNPGAPITNRLERAYRVPNQCPFRAGGCRSQRPNHRTVDSADGGAGTLYLGADVARFRRLRICELPPQRGPVCLLTEKGRGLRWDTGAFLRSPASAFAHGVGTPIAAEGFRRHLARA